VGNLDRDPDERAVLRRAQSGRFAGCPAHDQCGGPLLDLAIAESFECGTVDVSFIVERGGDRGPIVLKRVDR
jgi:hypothetical protein